LGDIFIFPFIIFLSTTKVTMDGKSQRGSSAGEERVPDLMQESAERGRVNKDIGKRRALETKQQREESYLASLIRSSNDAIISVDQNGILLSWNKGAEKLLGYNHWKLGL
jgi:PAS domain-containing protein